MRTRLRRANPPTDANELLDALRSARLLAPKQLRRLAVAWSESRPDEPDDPVEGTRLRAQELAATGLLTAWQVEQVLAGEADRLRVGHYLLLDWIGAGGMGSVYKAEHRLMKRVVALKVLGGAPGPGPQSPAPAAARFRREVEAAARLSHPHIVAAYDAIRARGSLILVMEYVEGIDLGRLTAMAGPLPIPFACEAVRQTAHALQYAHEHGLLHCDVKPSNLLLVHAPRAHWDSNAVMQFTDGRPLTVKLLDMGLARRIDSSTPSLADDLDGTPDYMAPERGGGDPIDGRSDLYSLGCTFYHLLTGQPPFPGGDGSAKVLRHRIDSPPSVRELRPDAPDVVVAVVERLTARDPAHRFASAADVAAALELCSSSHAGRPAPALLPRPAPDRAALRIRGSALLAVAVGLLMGGMARWYYSAPAVVPAPSISSTLPFVVEGRPGGFATLSAALAAAEDGAVVTIHGAGPYATPPLSLRGRSITLRGAPGERPCLEMAATAADPWQAILATDRDLFLERLELHLPASAAGRLICSERAVLRLTDCRLSAPAGAGIVQRNGGELMLQGCRIETSGTAVSVEVGGQADCKIRIMNTALEAQDASAAGLAVWAPTAQQPTTVEVELTGDTITAARATALTALCGPVLFTVHGNDIAFRQALLSCAGYASRDGWKRSTSWQGSDNHYHDSGAWLTVDATRLDVRGLAAWRALWQDGELGSR
ncbi:MAG TPA: serine/threonine-protein kinase [Gemmataceae bacterium]|nr:serine/threonine-protein kinase [Gemmataceae bacterium]